MLNFDLFRKDRNLKVLCLGAHSDDIEAGCGGTILKLIKESGNTDFHWTVFSGTEERAKESQRSAEILISDAASKKIVVKNFRDSYFPFYGAQIKDYFEELKSKLSPDIIFTHYKHDAHQDHRLISELTWNTFRSHFILEYEVPKYDGDLGTPNAFVHLEESIVQRKVQHISEIFRSQTENEWFTPETFRSILRIRGIESNSPTRYAEGFYCRKIILQ